MDKNACFRNIPKVDVLLEDPAIIALCGEYGRDIAVDCIRSCTDSLRAFISKSDDMAEIQRRTDSLVQDIRRAAEARSRDSATALRYTEAARITRSKTAIYISATTQV